LADHRIVLTASGSSSSQTSKRTLAPAPGVTPPPTDGSSYRFLSDVIIARGLVEPAAMKAALQASLAGRSLTEILLDNGELSEDDLARTLAEHHRLDFVDLDVFAVDPRATALVAPDVARRFGAVPIAQLESGAVVVALYDPNGSPAVLEFAGLTDRVIQPAVASRKQIEALIATLRRGGKPAPQAPAPAPAPEPPEPPAAGVPTPEPHLRSVPTGEVHISSREPDFRAALPGPEPSPRHDDRPEHDTRIDDVRERAETAERRRHESDERARAAEERARAAEEHAREAEELTRLAEARARAAEERALAAGELVDAAEARADGMSSAVDAANETLARLVRACELLEHEAETRGPELEVLRAALDSEREQRTQLESQLRHPQPSEEMLGLRVRIAELERQLADGARSAPPAAPVAESPPAYAAPPVAEPAQAYAPPAPPPPAPVAQPPQAYAPPAPPPPAPVAQPPQAYAPPAPPVAEPPRAYAAPAPPPVAEPPQAYAAPPPPPAPIADPMPDVVQDAYVPPIPLTIDIVGEPGVPYVSALAPMPSNDAPAVKKPKSDSAKARGLRRLISAIKRGA
jgi:hypothetical protein